MKKTFIIAAVMVVIGTFVAGSVTAAEADSTTTKAVKIFNDLIPDLGNPKKFLKVDVSNVPTEALGRWAGKNNRQKTAFWIGTYEGKLALYYAYHGSKKSGGWKTYGWKKGGIESKRKTRLEWSPAEKTWAVTPIGKKRRLHFMTRVTEASQ